MTEMIVATERTEAGGAGDAQHNLGTVRKEIGTEMLRTGFVEIADEGWVEMISCRSR